MNTNEDPNEYDVDDIVDLAEDPDEIDTDDYEFDNTDEENTD